MNEYEYECGACALFLHAPSRSSVVRKLRFEFEMRSQELRVASNLLDGIYW